MGQRLIDYAIVAGVVLAVFGLFRLSRIIMKYILKRLQSRYGEMGPDRTLFLSFNFLLAGLLFLPAFTSVLAILDNRYLVGGMPLHLVLVAISVILFSIAEDMLREYPLMELSGNKWSKSDHFKRLIIPFLVFWLVGVIFLSPIFYSGLTVILALFYLYALSCRKTAKAGKSGKSGR